MSSSSDAQEFLDDLYSKYRARKSRPLTIRTIEDKTIVSEYKPVSARTLQREGRDYSSFIVSPFEPVTIKETKPKEKNPLILESSVDEKPKRDFSFLEWIRQIESNRSLVFSSLGDIKNEGALHYSNFTNYGYVIADDNLNYIANSIEEEVERLKLLTEDSNGDGNVSIKEIFEQNKNNTNPDTGDFQGVILKELLFDNSDEENPEVLVTDQTLIQYKGIDEVSELEDIIFSNKKILEKFPDDPTEFSQKYIWDAMGYHKESNILNQYSINLKSIFLLKNKYFYTLPGASDVILILSAELNKPYKEKILNLESDIFQNKDYLLIDDRKEEEINEIVIGFYSYFFTPDKNLSTLSFPIVRPEVLSNIDLVNNYELLNNYLSDYTFKPNSNPINLIGFQESEYENIVFTQEELVNAKLKNAEGEIIGDGPGIFIEGENTFESVLKKYLIYEYENLLDDYISYQENTSNDRVREGNSIYYVLMELLWKKISPLIERGVIFKVNYSLNTAEDKDLHVGSKDLDLMSKYSNQILYIALNEKEYFTNFFVPSEGGKLVKGSIEEIKKDFFLTLYRKIMEFVFLTTHYSNRSAFAGDNDLESFEEYLDHGEVTLLNDEIFLAKDFLPKISIIYSEDNVTDVTLDTNLSERTLWSTVVDFARDENLKSSSIKSECVLKLKDFLNRLSLKIETIIEKNKANEIERTWERIVSVGNYNVDFIDIPADEGNSTRSWRVKDQYGKIVNDYFDIAMPLILTEFHIINVKTLSKFKTRQNCLKTLSKIKENEYFRNIKEGFLIIRNSIPSIIEIFNRFYNPNYFVDKAFSQKNSKEIQDKLNITKSSLENLINKTAIVKVNGKIGVIYNFDPLICYKADSDLITIGLREQQAGEQLASISEDYGRIYPILYPYSNVRVTNDGEATFYPNLLGFYNLWDEATGTESDAFSSVKRKHISFPGYYEESQNKFSGYNFKNMPVLSAGTYSRHAMVAPENPERRTVIGEFYIINDPSKFSPRAGIPRLTEIFYERHHRNRSLEIELKTTGNQSLINELKKEDLGNKANLVLGTPVFFLSEKVKSENKEYFTNKEMFVDLDEIEAIYFFDKKDYNPQKDVSKSSSKNTAYLTKARR